MGMESFSDFTYYAHTLSDNDPKKTHSLKDHPQIPLIADILNRQHQHHIAIISNASEKINFAFADGIAQHIALPNTSKTLRDAYFIYFDAALFALMPIDPKQFAASLRELANEIRLARKHVILVLNQVDALLPQHANSALHLLCHFLSDDMWRIIAFVKQDQVNQLAALKNYFASVHLNELAKTEQISLLKCVRSQLEDFHQVIISDETLMSAYALAEIYLPGDSIFDKTLELLDSASARLSAQTNQDQANSKSGLTTDLLTQLIASWSQIPLTHLQNNRFQAAKFLEGMGKHIFGQDSALNHVATLLQNACTKLHRNQGPLCSFLFVGPADSGKTEMATALAEYLFGRRDALITVRLTQARHASLAEIKITPKRAQQRSLSLLEAIQQTPFAVVLIEDVDLAHPETLDLLQDILSTGYVIDKLGNKYNFHHTIFIMTTRLSSEHLQTLAPTIAQISDDLTRLVLDKAATDTTPQVDNQFSAHELRDVLFPKLSQHFPFAFLQHVNIVPFAHLDYAAMEKIIRIKAKSLTRRVETSFGIKMTFAPEAIKFLVNESLWHKNSNRSIEKILELHLYSCVSHEILLRAEDKNRAKSLFVQLNDCGQLLRCEALTSEAALY